MDQKETEELMEIYRTHDLKRWSKEAFIAIEMVLKQRYVPLPEILTKEPMEKDPAKAALREEIKEEGDPVDRAIRNFKLSRWAISIYALIIYIVVSSVPILKPIEKFLDFITDYRNFLYGVILALLLYLNIKYIFSGRMARLKRKRRYQDAVMYGMEMLMAKPGDAGTERLMGECYTMLGEFSAAIRHLQNSLQSKPNQTRLYFDLAVLYAERGRIDTALDYIEKGEGQRKKIFFLFRTSKDLYSGEKAWVYYLKGDFKEALTHYGRAKSLLGRGPGIFFRLVEHLAPVHFRAGMMELLRDRKQEARTYFKRAIKASPSSHFADLATNELMKLK